MTMATIAFSLLIYFFVVILALAIERISPVEKHSASGIRLNYSVAAANILFHSLIAPATAILTVAVVNAAGGGWIKLPSSGWGFLAGLVAYALTVDALEYLFHRAQHRFPALWSMHSLHHSDTALSAASTWRHYWAEHGIKTVTIFLLAGVIFKSNQVIIGAYAFISYYNVFSHMNLRVGFGRLSFALNSPQYHRIHHSALPQHYDCNFAALFPIFDVIFRTYRQPRAGEFPPTGIEGNEQPAGLVQAFTWPARRAYMQTKTHGRPADGGTAE